MTIKESAVLKDVRLAVQLEQCTTFRNNVGRFKVVDDFGNTRWVQFGLCVGSSDTIGWTEHIIRAEDVGRRVAIFTAFETKTPHGKKPTDDQVTFLGRVKLSGGIAKLCRKASDAVDAIREWKAVGA